MLIVSETSTLMLYCGTSLDKVSPKLFTALTLQYEGTPASVVPIILPGIAPVIFDEDVVTPLVGEA